MTEEILQAAIMKLRARATERFGIIKDLYHRPATTETTDQIVQHAVALAQLEGAMITLQQYSGQLAKQTEDEAVSNTPEEPPTEVEVEEDEEDPLESAAVLDHEELMKRSPTYRRTSKKNKTEDEDSES
tara:strand:- start:515 stop:901 length:387 start_codon:yes stop_codon:yes gene_type:complete